MVHAHLDKNSTSEVTAAAVIANNVIVRGDGGGRGIQGSGITLDDSDNLTGANSITLVVALAETSGGTGSLTYTTGDILYSDAANSLAKLSIGSNTQALILAGGVPTWATITTVGTITTGTWTGTTVAATSGGTGLATYTTGDVIYSDAANSLAALPIASNADVLTLAAGIPSWATPTVGTVTSVSGTTNRISSTGGATPVIDIDSAYVGQATITTLGTVTTGTWTGTTVAETSGGTGLATYTAGDILYSDSANSLAALAIGSDTEVLTLASGLPSWAAPAGALSWTSITSGSFTGASLIISSGLGTAFDEYLFVLKVVSSDANSDFQVNFSDDAGVSYAVALQGITTEGADTTDYFAAQPLVLNGGPLGAADAVNVLLYIRSNKLANYKSVDWSLGGAAVAGDNAFGTYTLLTTADIDAVKFDNSAGDYDGGTYIIYGR